MIAQGDKVKIDYEMIVDGIVIDNSKEGGPKQIVVGEGNFLAGLESRIEGMKLGERKTVVVPPHEAYGEPNPEAFEEIEKEKLPKQIDPKEGQLLYAQTPEGEQKPIRIAQVKEETVVIDLNHPLCGKDIYFEVTVRDIQK